MSGKSTKMKSSTNIKHPTPRLRQITSDGNMTAQIPERLYIFFCLLTSLAVTQSILGRLSTELVNIRNVLKPLRKVPRLDAFLILLIDSRTSLPSGN